MRYGVSVLITVLLTFELAGPVAAGNDAGTGSRPPRNLDIALPLQVLVDGMWQASPTFRRQCARIGAAGRLQVRILPDERPRWASSYVARSVLSFDGGSLVSADVLVNPSPDAPKLIAHEMEHVIEQLDGVDLQEQAGAGAAWKSGDASFETRRAIEAGEQVARELMMGLDKGDGRAEAPPKDASRMLTVRQQDRDATPLSTRTARLAPGGRHVVFIPTAQLVGEDRNALNDVYVLDLETGRQTLESIGPDSTPGNGAGRSADITADGRFIVFESEAGNLVRPMFQPGTPQVFLRDRQAGTTRLLSGADSGTPASGPSRNPVISADGTSVAFESAAPDLLGRASGAAISNGVYVIRLASGLPIRVDIPGDRGRPPGHSMSPAISADGRFVAFATKADLTCKGSSCAAEPRDGNAVTDIYLRDMQTSLTRRISRSHAAGDGDSPSYDPAISGDGRFVAFVSQASNLTREPKTREPKTRAVQVFVHELATGTTELISRTRDGRSGNGRSLRPALSHDGSIIAFQSLACDLLCTDTCQSGERDINLLWDVFVHDRQTRRTVRASADHGAEWMENSRAPSLDHTGRILLFGSRHPVDVEDLDNDEDLFVRSLPR